MANFKIPLTNIPQKFEIALAGKQYLLTCKWNDADQGGWELDFYDAVSNEAIICCVPLITGADLLGGLEYLGFQGGLYIYTDGDDFAVPTMGNLGEESNLYFTTEVANG